MWSEKLFSRSFFYCPDEWPPCLSRCHRCGGQSLLCDSSFTNWHLLRSFPEVHWEQVDGELLRCEVCPSHSQTASHCQRAQQLVCSLGATFSSLQGFDSLCSRFPLGRLRSSISSGKQVPLKSHCLSAETEKQPEAEALDYLPLVSHAHIARHT